MACLKLNKWCQFALRGTPVGSGARSGDIAVTPIGQVRWRNFEQENIFVWQTEPVSGLGAWRPGSLRHRALDLVATAPDAHASRATLVFALPAPVMGASLLSARVGFSSGGPVAQRAGQQLSAYASRTVFTRKASS